MRSRAFSPCPGAFVRGAPAPLGPASRFFSSIHTEQFSLFPIQAPLLCQFHLTIFFPPSVNTCLQAASVLAHPLLQKLENSILLFLLLSLAAHSLPYVGKAALCDVTKAHRASPGFLSSSNMWEVSFWSRRSWQEAKKKQHKIA